MNPDAAELPLRDIHAAATQPWWPPAPGWWLLALIGLVIAFWVTRRLWRRYQSWRLRQALKLEFEGILSHYESSRDAWRMLSDTATFLRRLLVHIGGQGAQAGVVGEEWANHLSTVAPGDTQIHQLCRDLANKAYGQTVEEVDSKGLSHLANCWIDRCVPQGRYRV